MPVYLLAAAVNFDATIFDTNDLSVIRGSSLSVLQFGTTLLQHLEHAFHDRAEIEPLYSGASELALRFPQKRPAAPPRVKLEAPVGPQGIWRHKTLPFLASELEAGRSAEEVAKAWVKQNGQRLGPDSIEATKRSIVRQLEFWRADRAARAQAAAIPPVDCAAVEAAVEAFFEAPRQATLQHFCFAHAIVDPVESDSLADVLAALHTRLRTRQLQQLTVSLPASVGRLQAAEQAFCPFTQGRQPATPGETEKGRPISASARVRRAEGRDQKQNFYQAQLKRSEDAADKIGNAVVSASDELSQAADWLAEQELTFATEFADIVDDQPPDDQSLGDPLAGLPPNVRGKLAVIFFDGNGFSAKRDRCANLADSRKAFESYRNFCLALERNGGLILARLLRWMAEKPAFVLHRAGARILRFETLLFGGDDICFVLPAWGAFAFMEKLQEVLSTLQAPVVGRDEVLTYKAGMVLADHKSPVRDLRNVAEALARAAKQTSSDRNIIQVLALEGIDRADLDPQHLRCDIFGQACGEDGGAFGLEGKDWRTIRKWVEKITETVGRSQLHDWYAKAESHGILRLPGDDKKVIAFVKEFDARLGELQVPGELRGLLKGQEPLLANGAARWPLLPLYHVLTLADYIGALPLAKSAAALAA